MKRSIILLPIFALLFSCENAQNLTGQDKDKDDDATETEESEEASDKSYTFEEAADLMISRLVGEEAASGKSSKDQKDLLEGRSLVIANRLASRQLPENEVVSSEASGDSAQAGSVDGSCAEEDLEEGCTPVETETDPAVAECETVTNEDGDVEKICVGAPGEEEVGDHFFDHCFMDIAVGGDEFSTDEKKEMAAECPELIPVEPVANFCGADHPVFEKSEARPAKFKQKKKDAALRLTEEDVEEGDKTDSATEGEEVTIEPIAVSTCNATIESQVGDGKDGIEILKLILIAMLQSFDKDKNGSLSTEELSYATVIILKSLLTL